MRSSCPEPVRLRSRRRRSLRVVLVTMPWASLRSPSLALGTLTATAAALDNVAEVDTRYVNFSWAEHLHDQTGGRVGPAEYSSIAESYLGGIGEWIFAGALYDSPLWRFEDFRRHVRLSPELGWLDDELLAWMHGAARAFVQSEARRVAAGGYDVVGISTTFLQNVASLALARHVKQLGEGPVVVLGGANCDGEQGAALHRNFGFVDAVVRGEGELTFPHYLAALAGDVAPAAVAGLCWRDDLGRSVVNPLPCRPVPITAVPAPDHRGYFARLSHSPLRPFVDPALALEASRGCWWGERHHCTFCGLNGSVMEFRSKPPQRFLEELTDAVRRYRVLDVELTDNILDMRYLKSLLPRLARLDWDIRIFAEVKANLTRRHVRALRDAGVTRIQPGIESLAGSVLRLMDKGVTGVQNVRLLRDCRTEGVAVAWNLLYGFPGESEESYRAMLRQLPRLVHLPPPVATYRVALERFSPLFTNPALGLRNRGPAAVYRAIYDLPEAELRDLVYLFDSEPAGIPQPVVDDLAAAADLWQRRHARASLRHRWTPTGLLVEDARSPARPSAVVLERGGEAEAYLTLMKPRTARELRTALAANGDVRWNEPDIEAWLSRMDALGLVYNDDGRHVALSCDLPGDRVGIAASHA